MSQHRQRFRDLSRAEAVSIAILIALLSFSVGWRSKPRSYAPGSLPMVRELAAFEARFGRETNTEHAEEWAIKDFFGTTRNGVFVDVGANDYKRFNNTYYLETELGWSGIAVEPLTQFAADYQQHRPRTKFRPFFVSDVSNEEARIYLLSKDHTKTSGVRSMVAPHGATQELSAPTITLNDLLQSEGVDRIDFLTMDIEMWEPKALAGFDLQKYRPVLVCIEAHPDVRQTIIDYFWSRGYVVVGRYLRIDQVPTCTSRRWTILLGPRILHRRPGSRSCHSKYSRFGNNRPCHISRHREQSTL